MKKIKKEVLKTFKKGFNCSQAIFSVYSRYFDLDSQTALKISCGFGAGMGRLQDTCGAVSGALMVIGLRYGNNEADDENSKENTYSLVKQFINKFTKQQGTIKCGDIIGCDLNSPEGQIFFEKNNLATTKCSICLENAVSILNELLKNSSGLDNDEATRKININFS